MQRDLTLSDGRTLRTYSYGSGPAVLYHHGTPGCGHLDSMSKSAADAAGVQLLTYDRAGYGASSRNRGRSVADVAADMRELLDAYNIDRVHVIGWSGGGPHALATAALLPERVASVCALAGVAPFEAEGLNFLDGMGSENIEEFGLAVKGEAALQPFLESNYVPLASVSAQDLADAMGDLIPPADREVMVGGYAQDLADEFHLALAHGTDGPMDDDLAFVRPWGFALTDLKVPVMMLQGDQDRMVPLAHGKWLAAHIPNVQAEFWPGEGHISLVTKRYPEILRKLVALGS